MLNLNDYKSPDNEFSLYKGIPVALLNEVKKVLKDNGVNYIVRYRGPRAGLDNRSKFARQSGCLRRFAVSFSVYNPPERY